MFDQMNEPEGMLWGYLWNLFCQNGIGKTTAQHAAVDLSGNYNSDYWFRIALDLEAAGLVDTWPEANGQIAMRVSGKGVEAYAAYLKEKEKLYGCGYCGIGFQNREEWEKHKKTCPNKPKGQGMGM